MGSVSEARYCARGERCVRYDTQTGKPEKLSRYNKDDICERCQKEHPTGYKSSSNERWKDKIREAIEAVYVKKSASQHSAKASLWDLFSLDAQNGGWGRLSDRGEVLSCLDARTLTRLRDWLEENRDRVIERYGYYTWLDLRTEVGLDAWLSQLPPDMELLPDTKDGLPLQGVAVRTDGKKWDLNIPIRAELLRQLPRRFSERNYAKLLGISRKAYWRLRDAIKQEGFTLDKLTLDVLDRIVRGKKRGPERKL
jgi:hypothetical protein